jgi:hypothetical protein
MKVTPHGEGYWVEKEATNDERGFNLFVHHNLMDELMREAIDQLDFENIIAKVEEMKNDQSSQIKPKGN